MDGDIVHSETVLARLQCAALSSADARHRSVLAGTAFRSSTRTRSLRTPYAYEGSQGQEVTRAVKWRRLYAICDTTESGCYPHHDAQGMIRASLLFVGHSLLYSRHYYYNMICSIFYLLSFSGSVGRTWMGMEMGMGMSETSQPGVLVI